MLTLDIRVSARVIVQEVAELPSNGRLMWLNVLD
jgi:hypothetical protein